MFSFHVAFLYFFLFPIWISLPSNFCTGVQCLLQRGRLVPASRQTPTRPLDTSRQWDGGEKDRKKGIGKLVVCLEDKRIVHWLLSKARQIHLGDIPS